MGQHMLEKFNKKEVNEETVNKKTYNPYNSLFKIKKAKSKVENKCKRTLF